MKKVIIIFGFSGSGKSSLANLIAKKYKLRVVHPSGILRDLYEKKKIDISNTRHNKGFWESEKGSQILKGRLKKEKPFDLISDKILLKEVKKGNVVIDSWNLPWLSKKGIKIYLKADLNVRAKRVSKRNKVDYTKVKKIILNKDEDTYRLFKRLYNFDMKKDIQVFDLIINTNNLNKNQVFSIICKYLGNNLANR